jgi:hypothetical protein
LGSGFGVWGLGFEVSGDLDLQVWGIWTYRFGHLGVWGFGGLRVWAVGSYIRRRASALPEFRV